MMTLNINDQCCLVLERHPQDTGSLASAVLLDMIALLAPGFSHETL